MKGPYGGPSCWSDAMVCTTRTTKGTLEMSRTIKGTDRDAIRKARRAEKTTRRIRQQISRANGR